MTENEKIVKEIVERNEKVYGKIQDCCELYKKYCSCNNEDTEPVKYLKSIKKSS